MNTQNEAFAFMALALQAYKAKDYDSAGCLFAQAADCESSPQLLDALLQPVSPATPGQSGKPPVDMSSLTTKAEDEGEAEGEDEEDFGGEGANEAGDDEEPEEGESTSTSSDATIVRRRAVTSMHRIGQMLAASMMAVSSDLSIDADEDEVDEDAILPEPDPDIEGEAEIPASFSSAREKPSAIIPAKGLKSAISIKKL